MGRYRKRPVVVDAVRWTGNREQIVAFLLTQERAFNVPDQDTIDASKMNAYIEIETLEGAMRADLGDWLIIGVAGECYPCKPDIFEQSYEAVDGT
jgi:hypothetical protein